jgi:hypothetical protein
MQALSQLSYTPVTDKNFFKYLLFPSLKL